MEIYRKDRLPEEQARFASGLGHRYAGGDVSTEDNTGMAVGVPPAVACSAKPVVNFIPAAL